MNYENKNESNVAKPSSDSTIINNPIPSKKFEVLTQLDDESNKWVI